MAAKKKSKKRSARAKKGATLKKKSAIGKSRPARKKKAVARKSAPKKRRQRRSRSVKTESFPLATPPSGRQSGDLEGLSRVEEADSESVDELVEEGNAFEADAVEGVEDAGDEAEREVHTHEVPEDDVPEEYLDKD
jgi:hypothetical protein